MSSRFPDKYIILSNPSQLHLTRLRYTTTECIHCKKYCPCLMPVTEVADEETVYEEITTDIIILKSCCQDTILVCSSQQSCIDFFMS